MSERTFEELSSDYFDGALGVFEQRRFMEMLQDPVLAKRFVVSCQMQAMLAWEHGTMPAPDERVARPLKQTHRLRWYMGITVAAAAALVLYLASHSVDLHSVDSHAAATPVVWNDRSPTGMLARSHGGRLSVPDIKLDLREGDELRAGDYQLAAGFVEMDIDGVELTVESPAHFQLVSQERVLLNTGRVSVKVPKHKKRFQIETQNTATAEILPGTETGIDASEEACEIHVFEGDVEVLPRTQELPLRLTQARATRITHSGSPAGVDLDVDRFMRSLEEPLDDYALTLRSLGPVVYFRLESESDGVTLHNDAQQSRRTGDFGSVHAEGMGRPPFATGKVGTALRVKSENGGYASYAHYPPATKHLTVCAWVRADSRPRGASIVKNWTTLGGQFQLGLHGDDGDLEILVRNAAGIDVVVREKTPLPLRSWQFVAFVVDPSNVRLYRNAAEIGSAICEGLEEKGPTDLGIGVKLGLDGLPSTQIPGFWDGRIDELAIFHRSLSIAEVKLLYEAGAANKNGHRSRRRANAI